jgi:hypothetical protein
MGRGWGGPTFDKGVTKKGLSEEIAIKVRPES